jgi:hypothetical protein
MTALSHAGVAAWPWYVVRLAPHLVGTPGIIGDIISQYYGKADVGACSTRSRCIIDHCVPEISGCLPAVGLCASWDELRG